MEYVQHQHASLMLVAPQTIVLQTHLGAKILEDKYCAILDVEVRELLAICQGSSFLLASLQWECETLPRGVKLGLGLVECLLQVLHCPLYCCNWLAFKAMREDPCSEA